METKVIGIEVHPTETPKPQPPKEPPEFEIPEKWRQIMKKYKYNWRLEMLAKPKRFTAKVDTKARDLPPPYYVHPSVRTIECPTRVEQLSRAPIRTLTCNRRLFPFKKLRKMIVKYLRQTWNSMYNYYKKSEMQIKRRKSRISLRSAKSKSSTRSQKEVQAWLEKFAKPKKVHPPEPLPVRKRAKLEELIESMEGLAKPKSDHGYLQGRELPIPIKKECLKYEMSEIMTSLATTIPERYRRKYPKPPKPGAVKKSALTYTITEKVTKLAEPKSTAKTKESDLREDAFTISPNALKYRATPRIQELAQPISRK